MTHSKNLQIAANELAFISEEILAKLHLEEDVKPSEIYRLEDAIEAVKDALQRIALEEGLEGA